MSVMSLPKATTHIGPMISKSVSNRAIDVERLCTSPERIFTARFSASPGPSVVSAWSPSGCSSGSRASTRESNRSVLACLL